MSMKVTGRPRLLFVSPTFPAAQGNGLAMRAGMFLEALGQQYEVTLLVVPLFDNRTPETEEFARRHCLEVIVVEAAAGRTPKGRRPVLVQHVAVRTGACVRALGGRKFDVIHTQRLYMASLALSLASAAGKPRLHLDIDDVEPATHSRLAALLRLNGIRDEAEAEDVEADGYRAVEREVLPRFERLYVCSAVDARRIAGSAGKADVVVAPNAVRLPETVPSRLTTHPFTFLFLGTLGYYPNEDAARYFVEKGLPLLRSGTRQRFLVRIAGRGMPDSLAFLQRSPEVRLAGEVAEVASEYAEADAVIVPLRAGGGTRIKVLEAFAYQRPVVSTAIGIEGIEAEPGRHYLLADTPSAFARQCLRLMENDELRANLVGQAAELSRRYSQERVNEVIAALP